MRGPWMVPAVDRHRQKNAGACTCSIDEGAGGGAPLDVRVSAAGNVCCGSVLGHTAAACRELPARPPRHACPTRASACRSSEQVDDVEGGGAGLTQAQVAARLGLTQQGVSRMVQRALAELRRAAQEARLEERVAGRG